MMSCETDDHHFPSQSISSAGPGLIVHPLFSVGVARRNQDRMAGRGGWRPRRYVVPGQVPVWVSGRCGPRRARRRRDKQRLWRTVTRRTYQVTCNRVQLQNRLECLLEETHIKVSSLVADLIGPSARRMLRAVASGETDPATVAALGSPRLHATPDQLRDALGPLKPTQTEGRPGRAAGS